MTIQNKLHLVIIMGKITAGVCYTNRMGELYLGQLLVQC